MIVGLIGVVLSFFGLKRLGYAVVISIASELQFNFVDQVTSSASAFELLTRFDTDTPECRQLAKKGVFLIECSAVSRCQAFIAARFFARTIIFHFTNNAFPPPVAAPWLSTFSASVRLEEL